MLSLLRKRLEERSDSVSSCPSTPPPTTTWFEPPTIDFCLMTVEHEEKVFQLVIDTFFRDEPLNKCLAFNLPDEAEEFARVIISNALRDQCSFVAIDVQTQQIIGVALNVIKHRQLNQSNQNNFQSEKLRFILGVLQHVHGEIDLFHRFNAEHLLHIAVIAIDPQYRGLRLTEKFIQASLQHAKQHLHVQGVYVEATSLYSAKAFRKQDFQILNETIYLDYDRVRLANLAGEHDRCQLLAKEL